jgi:hypothetical protein
MYLVSMHVLCTKFVICIQLLKRSIIERQEYENIEQKTGTTGTCLLCNVLRRKRRLRRTANAA